MDIEVGFLCTIIACFIGLAGWLRGRDAKISNDSEWKGMVNAKLDVIVGIKTKVEDLEDHVRQHDTKLEVLDNKVNRAHERIDEMEGKK